MYNLNDPSTPALLIPVDLPPKPQGIDFNINGFVGATTSLWTVEHQAACCYYTICKCLELFQKYLPKTPLRWAATPILYIDPRAGTQFNAYYDRSSLSFFGAQDPISKQQVWAANSTDVVAHELGHALLDVVRPDLYNLQAMEVWAFHEAFADIHAILHMLQYDAVIDLFLQETSGDLSQHSILSRLAEEMGTAIFDATGGRMGHTAGALRDAINDYQYVEPESLPASGKADDLLAEPHNFGRVFLGAWYDVFVGIYNKIKQTSQPKDAMYAARDIMAKYTWGAIPFAPANIRFFSSFANAMLVVDKANNYAFDDIINKAFLNRKIIKQAIRPMVVLTWDEYKAQIDDTGVIYQQDNVVAVRHKLIQTLPLPVHMMNVQIPNDTFVEFNDGNCVAMTTFPVAEILDHAHQCVSMLKELDMIRPDSYAPFALSGTGDLIRSHFAGCCGNSFNNAKIKGTPEFGKVYKHKNNAGCSCNAVGVKSPCLKTRSALFGTNARSLQLETKSCVPTLVPGMTQDVVINKALRDPGTQKNIFAKTTLVPHDAETTVISYVVPATGIFYFIGVIAQGSADGVYKVYIDTNQVLSGRSSVAEPTMRLNFLGGNTPVNPGQTIKVTVEHFSPFASDFEGTIFGVQK